MKYEEAMMKSAHGFVVTRPSFDGKTVTGGQEADGSHPPMLRGGVVEKAEPTDLDALSKDDLHKKAKRAKVSFSESDTKAELIEKIHAAEKPSEAKAEPYVATDEDKAANDWSILV